MTSYKHEWITVVELSAACVGVLVVSRPRVEVFQTVQARFEEIRRLHH